MHVRRVLLSSVLTVSAVVLAAAHEPLRAQNADGESAPIETGAVEEEQVRLVILDVVVVDRHGNAISDLTAEDFEIRAAAKVRPVDTLDVQCDPGALAEPETVTSASRREVPGYSDGSRKIVLALDYLHLPPILRPEVLQRARESVRHAASPGDEVMVVALNGGLRVEQHFTDDLDEVVSTLDRMEFDITLWQPSYSHLHENLFVDPLVALLFRHDEEGHAQTGPKRLDGDWQGAEGWLCPVACGAALSDLGKAASLPLTLTRVALPVFLLPFAASIAREFEQPVTLSWDSGQVVTDGDAIAFDAPPPPMADVVLTLGGPLLAETPRHSRAETDQMILVSLGIYAARTRAPATEASRLAGAGAGLTDND